MKTIHNVETGEITNRELNSKEVKQQTADEATWNLKQAEIEARTNARNEVLAKLGLTEEELGLLGL